MWLADTIPGRQCMASCFFLLRQFEDVLLYLNSIKVKFTNHFIFRIYDVCVQGYFFNVDSFNFNFAQAKAATGNYREAEEVFLLINSETLKNDYIYISWLARCCEPIILKYDNTPYPPPHTPCRYYESQTTTGMGTLPQDGNIC